LLAVGFSILVAGALFTLQLVTRSAVLEQPSRVKSQVAAAPSTVWDAPEVTEARDEQPDGVDGRDGYMDLYGNEVSDAVATYTFDRSGSLYELHSPQTELPRLGSPKS